MLSPQKFLYYSLLMNQITSNTEYKKQKFRSTTAESSVIKNVEFFNCTFESCDFSETAFHNCIFEECIFVGSNFSNCKFPNTKIDETKFKSCKLIGIDWSLLRTEMGLVLDCEGCDLSYSSFFKVDISNSIFEKCKMHECDFTETKAKKARFKGTDLFKTRFLKSNLMNADFREAQNYFFDIRENRCEKAKFSSPEVLNLLTAFGIVIE